MCEEVSEKGVVLGLRPAGAMAGCYGCEGRLKEAILPQDPLPRLTHPLTPSHFPPLLHPPPHRTRSSGSWVKARSQT